MARGDTIKKRWLEAQAIADNINRRWTPTVSKNDVFCQWNSHRDIWLAALEGKTAAQTIHSSIVKDRQRLSSQESLSEAQLRLKLREAAEVLSKLHSLPYDEVLKSLEQNHRADWRDILNNMHYHTSRFLAEFDRTLASPDDGCADKDSLEKEANSEEPKTVRTVITRTKTTDTAKRRRPDTPQEKIKIMFWAIDQVGGLEEARKIFQAAVAALEIMSK